MGFGAYFKTITSIVGPKEGFNEVIGANIKLVSQYYCQPSMVVKNFTIGNRENN
jgi:hypothetical protein